MADVIPTAVQRRFADKLYEKRKIAALKEELGRSFSLQFPKSRFTRDNFLSKRYRTRFHFQPLKHWINGGILRDMVGSVYYIAPDVLKRNYGPEVDSIGVMLYILLYGVPPFWAESEHGILKVILEGPINLSSDPWPIDLIIHGSKKMEKHLIPLSITSYSRG